MDVRNNPYTRLVALEQGLREIFNDAAMTMPQTAAAIFFLADVDAVENCLLAKERNKDAHDLLKALKELRDKADESMRGPVVTAMTEADVGKMELNHKEMQKLATQLIELIGVLKPHIGDPEPSVPSPLHILLAQEALSDKRAANNQALCNGDDCRVESKFSKPDDSLTDGAIEYLKKSFHKLPHAGTAHANHVIAAAVKDGFQRNAVEWALVRMQEYGWLRLSIPVWGGVIGNHHSEAKHRAPVQEQKPKRCYFGTQEYILRLTEYFYNPSFCQSCSKLIDDYNYDRSECHDCRSPQGKLAELEVAIKCQHLYGNDNDNPERIHEWPTIRSYLRDKFGPDRTNMQLWEWMTDHLRVLGWDQEQWLRMKYGEFVDLLKSGLLKESSIPAKDDAATPIGMDALADLTMKQARSLQEAAEKERRNQITPDRLESAWDSIYVTSPTIGKPVDYARWTHNLITFAQLAKEHGYSELFLKAQPASAGERKALSLIQAAIRGGEDAIRLRLLELESPSADREWKIVFNHSSLFWSIVRSRGTSENDPVGTQSGEKLENVELLAELKLRDERPTETDASFVEKTIETLSARLRDEADAQKTREARIAALDIRHKHAILAFALAEKAIACPGKRFTREKAWTWVEEHYEDYRFPSKQAFMDYVTQARGKLGENVNQSRRGRSGRSVVHQSEI